MFKLRRQTVVYRHHGPTVRLPLDTMMPTHDQHGFNGKNHAGHQGQSIVIGIMLDKRGAVKFVTNAVTAILFHRLVTVVRGDSSNGVTNVRKTGIRSSTRINGRVQGFARRAHESSGGSKMVFFFFGGAAPVGFVRHAPPILAIRVGVALRKMRRIVRGRRGRRHVEPVGLIAHDDRGTIISVHAVQKTTHVKTHHVPVLQRSRIGNAVTHDFVDGGTNGFGKPGIIERRRIGAALFHEVIVHQGVNVVRRDAGDRRSTCHVQGTTRPPGGRSHAINRVRVGMNIDGFQEVGIAGHHARFGVGWTNNVRWHGFWGERRCCCCCC
mmetsp:Transcript_15218/g.42094  ORF Transcript_15218/g.42094 Transcript_15218/m.42094 type:complete len:324 (-) Transcript_15218:643-1614(-)